jgi:hypothetical protein
VLQTGNSHDLGTGRFLAFAQVAGASNGECRDRRRFQARGLRMIVVTGPRIEPRTLPVHYGLELHGYLADLYRQVAIAPGRRMDHDRDGPDEIAAAIAQEIGRPVDYRPVRGLDRSCEARLLRGVVIRARKRRALPGPRRGLIHQMDRSGPSTAAYM